MMPNVTDAVSQPLWTEHLVIVKNVSDDVEYSSDHGVLVRLIDGVRMTVAGKDKPPKTTSATFVQREATDTD
jgi:hypothetical protein